MRSRARIASSATTREVTVAQRCPPVPYTFDDLIGDVIGLLDALDVDRTNFVGSRSVA